MTRQKEDSVFKARLALRRTSINLLTLFVRNRLLLYAGMKFKPGRASMNSLTLEKSTTPVTLPVSPAKLRCHAKVSLIMTALFLILAVVLHRWQTPLAERLDRLRRDYQVDLDLSRHKVERLRVYQSVHQSVDLPKAAILNTNEWIQQMQMMTAGDERSEEHTPEL